MLNQKIFLVDLIEKGLLTGKYSSDSILSSSVNVITSLTSTKKTSLEISDLKNYAQDLQPLLKAMETIAKGRKKSIAQISLNYIICKGAIPIPGSRSVAQLISLEIK